MWQNLLQSSDFLWSGCTLNQLKPFHTLHALRTCIETNTNRTLIVLPCSLFASWHISQAFISCSTFEVVRQLVHSCELTISEYGCTLNWSSCFCFYRAKVTDNILYVSAKDAEDKWITNIPPCQAYLTLKRCCATVCSYLKLFYTTILFQRNYGNEHMLYSVVMTQSLKAIP